MLLNITNKYRDTHKAKAILMKWIYTELIRPKLTYACLIWGNKTNTKILHQKLNSLNRLACLLTTNKPSNELRNNIEHRTTGYTH